MAYMRERQSKWDRRHLVTVSTHLNDRDYDLLKAACRADCTTPYKLVRDFQHGYIEAAGERIADRADGPPRRIGHSDTLRIFR